MPNHVMTCVCDACRRDGTGDFAMREAFDVLRTDHDGRGFDLYCWIVDVRLRGEELLRTRDAAVTQRAA